LDAAAVPPGPNSGGTSGPARPAPAALEGGVTGLLDKARDTGFLDRAKEAADHAAELARTTSVHAGDQFRVASGQAKVVAGQVGKATGEALETATTAVSDPANQARAKVAARSGLTKSKSVLSGAIDRIDPGLMADLVIKATTLQEKANLSLRDKGSYYRINAISIKAGIPPDVSFSIGRVDAHEDLDPGLQAATVVDEPLAEETDGGPDNDPDPDDEAVDAAGPTLADRIAATINGQVPETDPLTDPSGAKVTI
jgi:hypothetical protein